VHIRLTLLCTGITTIIMIIMSCSYLYVSEKNLHRNQMYSFRNDMNTISTNLEQQSVITMEWLSKMESQGNYTFFLLDNGIPFLYNTLEASSEKSVLLEECLNHYHQTIFIDADNSSSLSPYVSYHTESEFISPTLEKKFFYSVLILRRNSSNLQVIVLSSLDKLEQQIEQQRYLFLFIDLITIFLLAVFSWIFTGILLKPIMENQKKQIHFVSSASHELRTPLAVILSSAECCQEADSDKKSGFLNTIISEGMRMKTLIDDMLTLSSSDNHRFSIEPAPSEIDTLVMNSYEAFDPLAKEKQLSLSVELPDESLPLCTCDKNRISQVLSILLHNAISYT
ncbi:MAG: HAMP domain-containing histidine kinase, partial [Lachnospiraceae bacterium]|nr:HAMP domain-containing histidine kinase [Lachnospiraceae bacterium]